MLTCLRFVIVLSATSFLLSACTRSGQQNSGTSALAAPVGEPSSPPNRTSPPVAPTPDQTLQSSAAASSTPTLAEAQATVSRVFRASLNVSPQRQDHSVLVGDFNNDGSQDIAIVVKPVRGQLQSLNNPYAPWMVEDLLKVVLPVDRNGVRLLPPNPGPVRIEENDELLAIVHGYQKSGWRNPQAQQSYLLRHAVGDGLIAQPLKSVLGDPAKPSSHSNIGGDVIREKLADGEGFVYWTGAKYAWRRK